MIVVFLGVWLGGVFISLLAGLITLMLTTFVGILVLCLLALAVILAVIDTFLPSEPEGDEYDDED